MAHINSFGFYVGKRPVTLAHAGAISRRSRRERPRCVAIEDAAGYKIPAHWHPTDEHVTVLSGTLFFGMGDKLDQNHSHAFVAGGNAVAPAHMNHYAWTKTGATIQVNLMGPFALTYVNPADDPSGSIPCSIAESVATLCRNAPYARFRLTERKLTFSFMAF